MDVRQIRGFKLSRMTLGTVQLGLPYGVANTAGKPSRQFAEAILAAALEAGINVFDTAPAYGDSESIIGSFLASSNEALATGTPVVVTKIPESCYAGLTSFSAVCERMKISLERSADALRLSQVPIVLLHGGAGIIEDNGWAVECLVKLRDEGLAKLIGASVCQPCEVEAFLKVEEFDVVQLPINLFDTWTIRTGSLEELNRKEILIFARSIFLQGLFFLNPDRLPSYLQLAQRPLRELQRLSLAYGRSVAEIALVYVRDLPAVSSIVLGVETVQQLQENIQLMEMPPLSGEIRRQIDGLFRDMPEALIRPSIWEHRKAG